jgi:dTDP-4-dehydrorhamnose reductase
MFTDQLITPTFIDDIATGVDFLISNNIRGLFHLVGSSHLSPYDLAYQVANVFGFDPNLVKKGSLVNYQKTLPPEARPYQKNLSLTNQKIINLGLKMVDINQGLKILKKQQAS